MIEWDVLAPPQSLLDKDEVLRAATGDRPLLEENSKMYYEAFRVLTTSRQILEGGYLGFITYSIISEYAVRNNISDFDIFVHVIQEIDAEYVSMMNKIVERRNKANNG